MVRQHSIDCSGLASPTQSSPYAPRATLNASRKTHLADRIIGRAEDSHPESQPPEFLSSAIP
jgi:hypothetical protein